MKLDISALEPAQVALLRRIRAALEARGLREEGNLKLSELPLSEASALADMLGLRATPKAPITVRLERIDGALRASSLQTGLLQTLTALDGPLRDDRANRAVSREAKRDFWVRLKEHPEVARRPQLASWVENLRRGHLGRIAQGQDPAALIETTLILVSRTPLQGIRLQVLAAELTGDPHALDLGMPLHTLSISALAALAETPTPTMAGERRALWGWAGVSVDDLSSDVLVHGLSPSEGDFIASTLRTYAEHAEPFRLTMRQLARAELDFSHVETVFVCENPTVLGLVAERLGKNSAPLVCTEGMLSGAAEILLRSMASQRVRVRFHGDFDWGGVRVGNVLVQRFKAEPWRYDKASYIEAVEKVARRAELRGSPVEASWDPALAPMMRARCSIVYEEQLIDDLLGDLRP